MSLLVTSCTMGKQPDRLLHKGPQYLRTRTNASLFAQHRKSAVQLLAASKAQFYNIGASVSLDKQQDLAGQHERYRKSSKQKEPARSKSEYDLSQLQLSLAEDESDENNNDTNDEFVNIGRSGAVESAQRLNLQDTITVQNKTSEANGPKQRLPGAATNGTPSEEGLVDHVSHEHTGACAKERFEQEENVTCATPQRPKLTLIRRSPSKLYENVRLTIESADVASHSQENDVVKKPVPLPRKSREKPVPPPRKHSPKTPQHEVCDLSPQQAAYPLQSANSPGSDLATDTSSVVTKKHSLVESLTQRFSTLSATPSSDQDKKPETSALTNNQCTYTAKPVFINRTEVSSQIFQAKAIFLSELGTYDATISSKSETSREGQGLLKGRKRCPDVPVSTNAVKRERKSTSSDISNLEPSPVKLLPFEFVPADKSNSSSASKSEMSIESVGQAVYESEINAIPTATMESDSVQGEEEEEAREVTRSNSSLSGRMDQQDLSPTPYCSSVPRSHSDISCRLQVQHSRDSSIVSNHSRLSRASAGADLENFFNQMGLEKGVLEPISRLKELHGTVDVFDSMSSLDSQDATSICSTFSRSEQEWSDSQSQERSQQQTSIVERNARIIKWLCNVRKAKTQPVPSETVAAGKA